MISCILIVAFKDPQMIHREFFCGPMYKLSSISIIPFSLHHGRGIWGHWSGKFWHFLAQKLHMERNPPSVQRIACKREFVRLVQHIQTAVQCGVFVFDSHLMILTWPLAVARISGVFPFSSVVSTSAPIPINRDTSTVSPFTAALRSSWIKDKWIKYSPEEHM